MNEDISGIEGRRVKLRPMTEEDAGPLFDAIQSSREVLRRRLCWVDQVKELQDEAAFIRQGIREREERRSLVCGIFDKQTNLFIGVAALAPPDTQNASSAELSGWIRADHQDRGYGTEAFRSLCDHAFLKMQFHRLYARIDPGNRPSRKVLKKLKFRYEGTLREDKKMNGRWVHQECWGVLRSEWSHTQRASR